MKKITLNLINEALSRDEMRALVGGGSGIGSCAVITIVVIPDSLAFTHRTNTLENGTIDVYNNPL